MDSMPDKRCMGFSPTLRGCVAPNAQMARAMGEVARLALSGVIANTYRSLIFEEEKALSEHFDALAIEWLSYFRLVGRLMIALGGDPVRCGVLRANGRHGVRERTERLGAAMRRGRGSRERASFVAGSIAGTDSSQRGSGRMRGVGDTGRRCGAAGNRNREIIAIDKI